jgi:hypothetical protein
MGKKVRSVKDEIYSVIDNKLYIVTKKGCWEFPPWSPTGGYATFSLLGKSYQVTRELWRLATGSRAPAGMLLCHTCDNPPCFNFEHLYLGTPTTNSADSIARGRSARMRFTALSSDDINNIRNEIASGCPIEMLAAKYKISTTRLTRIARGKELPTKRQGRWQKWPLC